LQAFRPNITDTVNKKRRDVYPAITRLNRFLHFRLKILRLGKVPETRSAEIHSCPEAIDPRSAFAMIDDLTAHIANCNGLEDTISRRALGIVLNAAERQGSPLAEAIFRNVPGARALAARTGDEIGAPTGDIARMIEQTPGGRRYVALSTLSALQEAGLDNKAIGTLLPSIGSWMQSVHGMNDIGHLGDLFGQAGEPSRRGEVRAA
jgi:hypothetical protein